MTDTVVDGVDYGPLVLMAGLWKGDRGLDIAPEPDGTEEAPFFEEINFELAGDLQNAEQQRLAILRYHQKVYRKSTGEQFHDQVGYWLWDAAAGTVICTLVIPRAVTLVAAGQFDIASLQGDSAVLTVRSEEGGDWGVAQSPFMRDNARTKAFEMTLTVDGDRMSYRESTLLDIYGREFDHVDTSELVRS